MVTATEPGAEVDLSRLALNIVEQLGPEQVTGSLDITRDELRQMLLGEMEFTEEVKAGLIRLDGIIDSGKRAVRLNRKSTAGVIEEASVPEVTQEQKELMPEIPGSSEGFGGSDRVMDHLKADLYAARVMATRNLMDLRLKDDEILTNQLLVLEIELTIVLHFDDSVPTPGLNWTPVQASEETEKRLRRLRWVHAELVKYDRGIRGLFRRWISGRRRSPREMLNEMMERADQLHRVGTSEAEPRNEVLRRALGPTGLDADVVLSLVGEKEPDKS